jgi:hypothetical protein
MRAPGKPWRRHVGLIRSIDLLNAWKDPWNSTTYGILRCAAVDAEKGISCKHRLCQYAGKRNANQTFFSDPAFNFVDCIPHNSTTSPNESGMLIFRSRANLGTFTAKILMRFHGSHNSAFSINNDRFARGPMG